MENRKVSEGQRQGTRMTEARISTSDSPCSPQPIPHKRAEEQKSSRAVGDGFIQPLVLNSFYLPNPNPYRIPTSYGHGKRTRETAQSWNLYSYVENDPMIFTDPYELMKESERGRIISATADSPNPTVQCSIMGAGFKYQFGKYICGGFEISLKIGVYDCEFGESISIRETSVEEKITEEDKKKFI